MLLVPWAPQLSDAWGRPWVALTCWKPLFPSDGSMVNFSLVSTPGNKQEPEHHSFYRIRTGLKINFHTETFHQDFRINRTESELKSHLQLFHLFMNQDHLIQKVRFRCPLPVVLNRSRTAKHRQEVNWTRTE